MTTSAAPAEAAPAVAATPPPRSPLQRFRAFGRPPRIMGIDVARGLALLGMVIAHVGEMPDVEWSDPQTWGGLVHGRSSILFAVLAGVSIALVTGRRAGLTSEQVIPARLRLVGRGGAIFLIGLVLELLGTPVAVILTFYGLLFIAAIPFLRWSARRLLITAAVIGLVGPVVLAMIDVLSWGSTGPGVDLAISGIYPITVWLAMLLTGMGLGRLRIDGLRLAVILLVTGTALAFAGYSFAAAFAPSYDDEWKEDPGKEEPIDDGVYGIPGAEVDLDGLTCDIYEGVWVNCYPEDEAFAGSESALEDGGSVEIIDDGSLFVEDEYAEDGYYEDESYLDYLRSAEIPRTLWDSVTVSSPHSGGVAEIVGSGGFALAVIGLCLLIARPLRWLLYPVAALGSMPLTAYAAHLIVIIIAMGGPMGMFPPDGLTWQWFCTGLLAGCTLWTVFLGRGPLERLVGRAANAMARVRADAGPPVS